MALDVSKLGYRPCVGIMVINSEGLIWIGRRPDVPNEPEGPAAGGRCPRAASTRTRIPPSPRCASWPRKPASAAPPLSPNPWTGTITICLPSWSARLGAAGTKARSRSGSSSAFPGPTARSTYLRAGHQIEFDTWRWAPLDEVRQCVVPFKRAVYDKVLDEFAPLVHFDSTRAPPDPWPQTFVTFPVQQRHQHLRVTILGRFAKIAGS